MSTKSRTISDAAVQVATGKNWQGWFSVLDAAGALNMSHTQIAAYMHQAQGVPAWWSQMVANTYEHDHGLREKHQKPDGYEISVSKTMETAMAALFRAWIEPGRRRLWLPDGPLDLRKTTQDRFIRSTWVDGRTSVEVNLYDKGDSKSQVVVRHSKLAGSEEAERMKVFWREALRRLAESL